MLINSLGNNYLFNQSNQGFSLVESLIAIVILGIVFTGGMAFYYHSNELYYHGLHSQMATWVADTKMEEIKNLGCTAASADAGSHERGFELRPGPR